MSAERVEHLDDPRVAPFRNVRDRDLQRDHLFMAEGRFVVRALLTQSLYDTHSILVTPAAHEAMADVLDGRTDVLLADQQVMNGIVGFDIHRGCLAAGIRRPVPPLDAFLDTLPPERPALLVLLEDLTNHDNVGAIFRTALAFDAAAILVTRRTCDPLYRKSIRVSMGAALRLPFIEIDSAAHACALLHQRGFTTLALTPAADALPLEALAPTPRLALLLGEEGPGLTPEALAGAGARVRINTGDCVDSLNVAAAAAIAIHACTPRRYHRGP
ncbi:MAG: RNA methyltransferase [Phycisphaerales bacterium]|nr:RNA methyltransferase [Phycisphaerales bacterium]